MQLVYIVFYEDSRVGTRVVGVFDSEEAADKQVDIVHDYKFKQFGEECFDLTIVVQSILSEPHNNIDYDGHEGYFKDPNSDLYLDDWLNS